MKVGIWNAYQRHNLGPERHDTYGPNANFLGDFFGGINIDFVEAD